METKKGIKLLEPFAGKWNTHGIIAASDGNPPIEIRGTDLYEWFPGGHFLVHKVDVLMGNTRHNTLEIIGYDPAGDTYPMQYFDSSGESGQMRAKFRQGVWTFESDSLRFTGSFTADQKTLSGFWEKADNGKWSRWMEIRLVKDL